VLTVRVEQLLVQEEGVTSIEYALLASLIAVVCGLAVMAVGTSARDLYTAVCNVVAAATGNPPC
jgi:pilus assembly protein Flp/PilA